MGKAVVFLIFFTLMLAASIWLFSTMIETCHRSEHLIDCLVWRR